MKKTVMGLFALALTMIATACNPMDYIGGADADGYCGGHRSVDCPQ